MIFYVLRHAIALDRTEWKGADSDRPLTKDGIRKMKEIAEGMKTLDLTFDWILTSPFRRAYDTARLVAKRFKAEGKLKVSKSLAPDGDPKLLVRRLALDFRSWESVLLVGHEPYLTKLLSVLLAGHPDASLELKKGGLCRFSAHSLTYARCATLEWWLPPKFLRKLR